MLLLIRTLLGPISLLFPLPYRWHFYNQSYFHLYLEIGNYVILSYQLGMQFSLFNLPLWMGGHNNVPSAQLVFLGLHQVYSLSKFSHIYHHFIAIINISLLIKVHGSKTSKIVPKDPSHIRLYCYWDAFNSVNGPATRNNCFIYILNQPIKSSSFAITIVLYTY